MMSRSRVVTALALVAALAAAQEDNNTDASNDNMGGKNTNGSGVTDMHGRWNDGYLRNVTIPRHVFFRDILESRFYQPGDSPTWGKGPTKVVAAMRLQNLLNLDTRAGTYSIDFALILQWDDSRLFWRPDVYEGIKDIIFSRSAEDLVAVMGQTPAIWRPDIQFENAMNWHSHDLLGVMTRLHNTGMVTWSRHIVASFANTFDFTMFPFDYQALLIDFRSIKFSSQWQSLDWKNGDAAMGSTEGLELAQNITSQEYTIVSGSQRKISKHFPGWLSKFDSLEARIILQRKMFPGLFFKIIFPIAAIVLISTLTFRMTATEYAARIPLGVTCTLTQVAFMDYVTVFMPRVGYLTWMDIFSLTSFAFNVFALVEYGFLIYESEVFTQKGGSGDWNAEKSERVDIWARKWVPIIYMLFVTVMLLWGVSFDCPEDMCPSYNIR